MFEFPNLGEIVKTVRTTYRTRKGLGASFLLLVPIFAAVKYLPLQLGQISYLYLAIAFTVTNSIVWLFKSGKIIIPTQKILLVFSVRASGKSEEHFCRIIEHLEHELNSLDMLSNFSIKCIGYDRFKHETREAHRYRDSNDIDMLVWGNAQNLKEKGKEISPFQISFTYRIRLAKTEQQKQLAIDSALLLGDKRWLVYEEDSHTYIVKVTGDLLEVILFLLAISFLTTNRLDFAIRVLRRVLVLFQIKNDQSVIGNAKINRTLELLSNALWVKSDEMRYGNKTQALTLMKEFLDINPKSFAAHMNIARLEYELGRPAEALEWTRKARKIDHKNPILLFNFAFFRIVEKKYEKAARLYHKIVLRKNIQTNFAEIIEFLGNRYDEDKGEHAYLFAMGVVNFFHLDQETGKKQLRTFLKVADQEKYGVMVQFASEYVRANQKQKKSATRYRTP